MTLRARLSSFRLTVKQAAIISVLATAAVPISNAFAQGSEAAFTIVESGQGFGRLQDAVNAIGAGTGTIMIAPGRYRECAVQEAGSVSFLAREAGTAIFDGVTCEGKAALVLRGRSADIFGLVFQNMAVPDYNGAGIRLEHGNLVISQSWFRDSQQGILTGDDEDGSLIIDRSTFSGLGNCEDRSGCAHSLYVGYYGQLRVTNSRFERGTGGHYVKSRAPMVQIASSSFDDAAGFETNYMIDLSVGASGQISNNWFVQGESKQNYSAFIAVSPEARHHDETGLVVAGNTARFAPGVRRNSTFVADWSGQVSQISGNQIGSGIERYERR